MISESDASNLENLENLESLSPEVAEAVEELTAHLAKGEAIDLEAICERYPAAATQLRRLFPTAAAMAFLGESTRQSTDQSTTAPCDPPLTGVLGDFRLVRELGRGGMGIVYEAEQVSLHRLVALKILPFAAVLDQRQLQRFRNESQAAAMLKHPNIVTVHSVGTDRGVHFYAMELISGQSLSAVIGQLKRSSDRSGSRRSDDGRPPTDASSEASDTTPRMALSTELDPNSHQYYRNVTSMIVAVAEALDYAHQRGIVHRDIKPSNLLLDERGNVSITDFGLAQFQNEHSLTMSGDLLGTIRYMSPEQADGKKLLDHRTDIYSLGLVLYEMLVLRPAFVGIERGQLLRQIAESEPAAPRKLRPMVPHDLETITLKAIAKEPEARYQSGQEFAADLRRFLDNRPIQARRVSHWGRMRRWVRRNPLVTGMTTAIITLLLVLAGFASWSAVQKAKLAQEATRLYQEAMDNNYASTVGTAYRVYEDGDISRAESLIKPHFTRYKEQASAPFELKYLWNALRNHDSQAKLLHTTGNGTSAVSQDGRLLAVLQDSGHIQIWDVQTLEVVRSIYEPKVTGITMIEFSSASHWLAVGTKTGDVHLLSVAGNELTTVHETPQEADVSVIVGLAFSADDTLLTSTHAAGAVRLFHLTSDGRVLDDTVVDQFDRGNAAAAFARSGAFVVTAGGWSQAFAHVWSLPDRRAVKSLVIAPKIHAATSIAISSDDSLLVTAGATIKVWNTADWTLQQRFDVDLHRIRSVAFAPDDSMVVAADRGSIRRFDVRHRRELSSIPAHRNQIMYLRFSAADNSLISVDRDGIVKIWPATTWKEGAGDEPVSQYFTCAGFVRRSNQRQLLVSRCRLPLAMATGDLSLINLDDGTRTQLDHSGRMRSALAVSPTDPNLAAAAVRQVDGSWSVELWDLQRRQRIEVFPAAKNFVYDLVFSSNGKLLASVDLSDFGKTMDSSLIIWDVDGRRERFRHVGSVMAGVDFAPNSKTLAVTGRGRDSGELRILDIATGEWQPPTIAHHTDGLCVKYLRHGEILATGSMTGVIAFWDLVHNEQLSSSYVSSNHITSLALSPDQQTLAIGDGNGNVALWDTRTLSEVATLRAESLATALEFSRDGSSLAASCVDGRVVVWSADGNVAAY